MCFNQGLPVIPHRPRPTHSYLLEEGRGHEAADGGPDEAEEPDGVDDQDLLDALGVAVLWLKRGDRKRLSG